MVKRRRMAAVNSRPPANIELTKTLAKSLYNINVKEIKQLNGYDDRNFYIKTNDSKEFILKLTNSEESSETGLLDSINEILLHLYNNGIKTTVPLLNSQATYLTYQQIPEPGQELDASSERLFGFRLLEYIPGKLLLDVPFTPSILEKCGELLAKVTIALETFSNPFLLNRKPFWSLLNARSVAPYLYSVDSPLHRSIVTETLNEFEILVMSRLDQLEHSIIHGDFNEQNIIVEASADLSPGVEEYETKAVIDLNDAHYAPKIFDLAIHLAYAMLEFKAGPQVLAPGFGLSGYLRHKKLSENELNVLYVCIKARLCQSLVMGAYSYRMDPTNVYVLSSAKNGWPALLALHGCKSTDILNKWLNIHNNFSNQS